MYNNLSNNKNYPKTLFIHNSPGGMIWQVYHVKSEHEAKQLSENANRNGFMSVNLKDYDNTYDETFPDWRETEGGKKIINNKL